MMTDYSSDRHGLRAGADARRGDCVRVRRPASMEAFVDKIKQYPAKEQSELRVRVMLPGNMFPGLTPSEQRDKYEAEAFGYELAHTFPKKVGVRAKPITCEGIRFLCVSDVMEDPNHTGFIIPTTDWNRHRHDTYKNNPDAEKPYIRQVAAAPTLVPSDAANETPQRPPIYSEFELVSEGTHEVTSQKTGTKTKAKAEFWKCKNSGGQCKYRQPIKVVNKASGKLFAHLKVCNPAAHIRIKLESAGTDLELDEKGHVRTAPVPPATDGTSRRGVFRILK